MPTADVIAIADAVVTEINDPARNWLFDIEASRKYLAVHDLADLPKVALPITGDSPVPLVEVIPLEIAGEDDGRTRKRHHTIFITVQCQVDKTDSATLDALVYLCEQLEMHFAREPNAKKEHKLEAMEEATVRDYQRPETFDADELDSGKFVGQIELTISRWT